MKSGETRTSKVPSGFDDPSPYCGNLTVRTWCLRQQLAIFCDRYLCRLSDSCRPCRPALNPGAPAGRQALRSSRTTRHRVPAVFSRANHRPQVLTSWPDRVIGAHQCMQADESSSSPPHFGKSNQGMEGQTDRSTSMGPPSNIRRSLSRLDVSDPCVASHSRLLSSQRLAAPCWLQSRIVMQ